MILYNSENSIRNINPKTVSVIRLDYKILLKSLLLTLRAGSAPESNRQQDDVFEGGNTVPHENLISEKQTY